MPFVHSLFSATILAYGQTSSGKTVRLSAKAKTAINAQIYQLCICKSDLYQAQLLQFTMSGTAEESGVAQLCTRDIFDTIEASAT